MPESSDTPSFAPAPASAGAPVPGACYKFIVKSAEEAATLIRERLGPGARVLTVRSVESTGLSRWWSAPSLEVIAQLDAPAAEAPGGTEDKAAPSAEASAKEESPFQQDLSAAEEKGEAAPKTNVPAPAPSASRRAEAASPPAPRPRRTAPTLALPDLLRRSGLSELALGRLQQMSQWPELMAAPLHRALAEIGRHLQEESTRRWSRAPLGRAAFLGTPGVGRTTALCKWLGIEVFRRARSGHIIMAEFDRPNSPGALPVFCEALGVPVARHPASTHSAAPGGFVYFDLPGISLRDDADNSAIADFLAHEHITQRVLVLNAAYDHPALRAAYAAGRSLGATHLVFTHLDEVPQWGKLWDYLLDGALEPLFLATGPSLTGDCEEDVFGHLVRRTLAGQHESLAASATGAEAPRLSFRDHPSAESSAQPAQPSPLRRAASDRP